MKVSHVRSSRAKAAVVLGLSLALGTGVAMPVLTIAAEGDDAQEVIAADDEFDGVDENAANDLEGDAQDFSAADDVLDQSDETGVMPTSEDEPQTVDETLAVGEPLLSSAQASSGWTVYRDTLEYKIDSKGCLTLRPLGGRSYATVDKLGDFPTSVTSIKISGTIEVADSLSRAFSSLSKLKSIDLTGLKTSSVTDSGLMFSACMSLESVDLSVIDTQNVTDMWKMFYNCSSLKTVNLKGLDTSKVTDMSGMFHMCKSLEAVDMSDCDASKVTDMKDMFHECQNLQSVSLASANTVSLTSTKDMFSGCIKLKSLDISGLVTSNVTDMSSMFHGCKALASLDVSGFDTSKAKNMGLMFSCCSGLESLDLSGFNTSKVTSMKQMFISCESLRSLDLSSFDTSQVSDMNDMFQGCSSLETLDLSSFDTSNVGSWGSVLFGDGVFPKTLVLGEKFTFFGPEYARIIKSPSDTSVWGDPSPYTGRYVSSVDGVAYDYDCIPEKVAATYTAETKTGRADAMAAEHKDDLADGAYTVASSLRSSGVFDSANGGTANGTAVQLYASNDTTAQIWQIVHDGDYVVIKNKKSGKVLDCPSGSSSKGTKLQLWEYNGSRAQKWIAIKLEDNSGYVLRSALDPDVCIDLTNASTANGTRLQLYTANSTGAQIWTFVTYMTKEQKADAMAAEHVDDLADGTYTIASALRSGGVFDAAGGNTSNGTAVQLYDSNDTVAQVWEVTHKGDYVVIKNAKSGKALNCTGGSSSAGTKLQLWEYNGSRAQLWVAVKISDDVYEFRSALNPMVAIDLSGAATANGTRLQLYTANGTNAQRWNLSTYVTKEEKADALAAKHVDDLADGTYTIATALSKNNVFDAASGATSNGTAAQLYASNDTEAQAWTISHEGNYVVIRNANSGLALDCPSGSSSSGTKLQLWSYNGSRAQLWIAVKLDNNAGYELRSALDPDVCIDLPGASTANGTRLQLYKSNSSKAQFWTFDTYMTKAEKADVLAEAHAADLADGTYTVASKLRSNGVVDAAGGSTANGAAAQLYDSNGTAAQSWEISHKGNYVVIRNAKSGLALDCPSGSSSAGTMLQLWEYNGSRAQLWIAVKLDNNAGYELRSALDPDVCIDLPGASMANGTRLQLYTANSTAAQRWTFLG